MDAHFGSGMGCNQKWWNIFSFTDWWVASRERRSQVVDFPFKRFFIQQIWKRKVQWNVSPELLEKLWINLTSCYRPTPLKMRGKLLDSGTDWFTLTILLIHQWFGWFWKNIYSRWKMRFLKNEIKIVHPQRLIKNEPFPKVLPLPSCAPTTGASTTPWASSSSCGTWRTWPRARRAGLLHRNNKWSDHFGTAVFAGIFPLAFAGGRIGSRQNGFFAGFRHR